MPKLMHKRKAPYDGVFLYQKTQPMTNKPEESFVHHIVALFEVHRNDHQASMMSRYMKDQFGFLGIQSPLRRELTRSILANRNLAGLSAEELIPLVMKLWELPYREYQYLAMDLLNRKMKKASYVMIEPLEYLIVTKSWWDTVDMIASHHVGPLFLIKPELVKKHVSAWMSSNNLWLQRTAILFQLSYKGKTNEALLYRNIGELSGSREFFIQKAIGWALREYAKTNPGSVVTFVVQANLASLSRREALRKLTK